MVLNYNPKDFENEIIHKKQIAWIFKLVLKDLKQNKCG